MTNHKALARAKMEEARAAMTGQPISTAAPVDGGTLDHGEAALLRMAAGKKPSLDDNPFVFDMTPGALVMLKRVDSPWTREPIPQLDPNGEPMVEPETGEPIYQQVKVQEEDTLCATYILLHQEDDDILDVIDDRRRLLKESIKMFTKIGLKELLQISEAISDAMRRFNESLNETGMGAGGSRGPK